MELDEYRSPLYRCLADILRADLIPRKVWRVVRESTEKGSTTKVTDSLRVPVQGIGGLHATSTGAIIIAVAQHDQASHKNI